MSPPPLVYAIVLTWNSAADVPACLASLVEQDYDANLHVLVVDNGSHDGTPQAVAAGFPQVELLQLDRNHGYAGGNNLGIRQALAAGASYVLLLNPDTIVERAAVAVMAAAAEADPALGMVGPALVSCHDPDRVYVGGWIDWRSGDGRETLATATDLLAPRLEVEYVPGCALLVKTEVVGQIGLLDERYFAYYEDVDWCLRAKQAGYSCAVTPQARVHHQNTVDVQIMESVRSMYYPRRNQLLFLHTYGRKGDWRVMRRNLGLRLNEYNTLVGRDAAARARTLVDGMWDGVRGISGAGVGRAPVVVLILFAAAARLYAIRRRALRVGRQWPAQVQRAQRACRRRLSPARQIVKRIVRPLDVRMAQTLPAQLPPPLPVTVVGYIGVSSGMGEAARGTIQALQHVQHPLHYIDLELTPTLTPADMPPNGQPTSWLRVNIIHANAVNVQPIYRLLTADFFANKPTVGFWYWEMPSFPARWYGAFALFDEVWAGSRYTQAALAAVAPIPIVHMRPLVRPAPPAAVDRADLGLPPDRFVFLFSFDVLSILERKNPWAVIRAFRQAFGAPTTGPLLVMKINNSDLVAGRDRELGLPTGYVEKLATALHDVNGILVDKRYDRATNSALMAACDCYVSLHRCEGFGLTMAEAMYLSKPCIATGYSGNLDYMTPTNSYPVGYRLVELERDWGPYESGDYWAEPDEDHAAALMTTVYDRPEEAAARGSLAAHDIRHMYGSQAVGHAMQQRLQLLAWRRQSARRFWLWRGA
ncbi:MAG: glycosyltransferase [Chloroflexi bacterium]|nr:glycosyltransferase [Chloroflexota bacterium]MBU1746976.1 glycosyltransferase [Chloroflexota bacterium]